MKINGLFGSSLALKLSELLQKQTSLSLVITPDSYQAQLLNDAVGFFSDNRIKGLIFPDYETLPYDLLSPHQSVISERLKTLSLLSQGKQNVIFASITSLMHHLPPTAYFNQYHLNLSVGDELCLTTFKENLSRSGYHVTSQVVSHGECAIRGSIIDIFPMGSAMPYRIDLFDNEIESIRLFNPETQCSIEKVNQIDMLPAHEFPTDDSGIKCFKRQFREQFSGNPRNASVYNDISDGILPSGIESYLPLFFNETATIFDYLANNAELFIINDCYDSCQQFQEDINHRYEQRAHDVTRPILAPKQLFIPPEDFFAKLKQFTTISLSQQPKKDNNAEVNNAPKLLISRQAKEPMAALATYLKKYQHKTNVLICESAGRREVLIDLLNDAGIAHINQTSFRDLKKSQNELSLVIGPLTEGAELLDENINIIVEGQLFDIQPVKQKARKAIDPDLIIKDLTELKIGAAVVHIDHGVGRYQGLTTITTDNKDNEFLILEYKNKSRLYVPVTSLHLITRYSGGNSDTAPQHQLGSGTWEKEKKKVITEITDVAAELLDIYAERQAKKGIAFNKPCHDYQTFKNQFPFDETNDQKKAINDILSDMCQAKPMDRLICGDVGFGKTEVAMRAAFLAVQSQYQVCFLAPTTLLAEQHYQNLIDRFSQFPVNVALLSRFKSKKQVDQTITEVAAGKVDILVGTHKLFSKSIAYKNLGLLIIDEEHRFGVKQKEHIKAIKTDVDTLTLTATPIPRTLNMAMGGLQDISIIATPPAKRLAIKTFQYEKNKTVIKDAISREILRGGQVFYLHNDVSTMENTALELAELVPEAKIEIAHGQMRERQLEKVMSDFYHHRFNVLLCTTIIETGIDIPTANTIIIERADKFGLAQLHQLRGRVGRSHHQAYAYLLTPHPKAMTKDANKRLEALLSIEDLGAGFILASHDLEIRGAGELLGDDQSGHMHAIGFSLYMELLDKAVNAIKSGDKRSLHQSLNQGTEIQLTLSSIIPKEYINDIHLRLTFYKRIANAACHEELKNLQVELIDRFGLLPESIKNLFELTKIKLNSSALGISKIRGNNESVTIEFEPENKINPAQIIHLIQLHAKRFKLNGPNKLVIHIELDKQLSNLEKLLKSFSKDRCQFCD